MEVITSKQFKKAYDKLQIQQKTKVKKVLKLLRENELFYPGLNTKKMQGLDRWEARIDKHYRLTFEKTEDTILLRTVGPHDEGLGKK
jgi:mRNA-degrading endonuclease YafQ of YafQ-DinJ toxin-antitoxin module